MEHHIFLLDVKETASGVVGVDAFFTHLEDMLKEYCQVSLVTSRNTNGCIERLKKGDVVVVANGNTMPDALDDFLKLAVNRGAEVYPIAMEKKYRMPASPCIKDKQSYDVAERMRWRDLSGDYVSVEAEALARKIISKVLFSIYSDEGQIFISHRRLDGEEIAATLCDALENRFKDASAKTFRDVTRVKVGEKAQGKIEEALAGSDIFLFLQTPKAHESEWVQKELRFALIHKIPVLWIRIDNAKKEDLLIQPSDKPPVQCSSADLHGGTLTRLVDCILELSYEMQMEKYNAVFGFSRVMKEISDKLAVEDGADPVYICKSVTTERSGYFYPQRNIRHYAFPFGRTPLESDIKSIRQSLPAIIGDYDSCVILTDKILAMKNLGESMVEDTFDNYYAKWRKYFLGKTPTSGHTSRGEIIISGAFPKCDDRYKQGIVNAVITAATVILQNGYDLTFGAHPTFQELFIDIAKELYGEESPKRLHMYLSRYFEKFYGEKRSHFMDNADVHESEILEGKDGAEDRNLSLTEMRQAMIQRGQVKALLCIGGLIKEKREDEGVREEIKLARECGIPVFLFGAVGGCSSVIAQEYTGKWDELNNGGDGLNEDLKTEADYYEMTLRIINSLDTMKEEDR